MKVLRSIGLAFALFSRLPAPNLDWQEDNMSYALAALPLVGLVIGLLLTAWQALATALGFGPLLQAAGLTLVPLSDFPDPPEVIEDGATFLENAMKKAGGIAAFTGLPSMADDSGLVVDALGGRPGVLSARYGGPSADDADRNRMILEEMRGIPAERRAARFVQISAAEQGVCATSALTRKTG